MKTVTQAYIEGIREGRAMLKHLLASGITREEAVASELATCSAITAMDFGGEMAEFNRGIRDFWRHQVKHS